MLSLMLLNGVKFQICSGLLFGRSYFKALKCHLEIPNKGRLSLPKQVIIRSIKFDFIIRSYGLRSAAIFFKDIMSFAIKSKVT